MNSIFLFFNKTGIVFEILALVFAIVFYKKYSKTSLFIVLPYLLYLVATEIFCKFFYRHPNKIFYNPILVAEGIFYLYGFYTVFQNSIFKKLALIFIGIFIIASIANLSLLTSFENQLISYSYSIGCVLIIILYLLYIYELSSKAFSYEFDRQLFFWIANGIFIFLILRIIPEFILNNHANRLSFNENAMLKIIKYLGSDILYLFFIIGFIKCKNQVSYSK